MTLGLEICLHYALQLDVEVALELDDCLHFALWLDVEVAPDMEGSPCSALGLDEETILAMLYWLARCCFSAQGVEEVGGMDFQLCLLVE